MHKDHLIFAKCPIKIEHLLHSMKYLNGKCKYYSLVDILHISLTTPMLVGGWAHDIMQEDYHNLCNMPFNIPNIYNAPKGLNEETDYMDEDFIHYGTLKQLQKFILGDAYKDLLQIKIRCSSFFLWEVIPFIRKTKYSLYNNIFFNDLSEFKEFCLLYSIDTVVKDWEQTKEVYEAFYSLGNKIYNIETKFLIIHENVYCPKALVSDLSQKHKFNTGTFIHKKLCMHNNKKIPRTVLVPNENKNQCSYSTYMHSVLGLEKSCFYKKFYQEVINYFQNNNYTSSYLTLGLPHLLNFLKSIKSTIHIIDKQLFKQKGQNISPVFFSMKYSDIERINHFAQAKNFTKIIIINLINCEEDEYIVKKKSRNLRNILVY